MSFCRRMTNQAGTDKRTAGLRFLRPCAFEFIVLIERSWLEHGERFRGSVQYGDRVISWWETACPLLVSEFENVSRDCSGDVDDRDTTLAVGRDIVVLYTRMRIKNMLVNVSRIQMHFDDKDESLRTRLKFACPAAGANAEKAINASSDS